MPRLDIIQVTYLDVTVDDDSLTSLLAKVTRESRRKGVDAVRFEIDFGAGLLLRADARERGAVFSVDIKSERRRYVLSVDGVHRALADFIRLAHPGDPAMLDAYEQVLTGVRRRHRDEPLRR